MEREGGRVGFAGFARAAEEVEGEELHFGWFLFLFGFEMIVIAVVVYSAAELSLDVYFTWSRNFAVANQKRESRRDCSPSTPIPLPLP